MKTLRDYINLIEAAESDFNPTKSKVWAKTNLSGSDNLKGSMQVAKYDQNATGEHRFTTMSQTDDDDEGTLTQRTLPAGTNLSWITNEEETSEESIKRIEQLQKR